MHTRSQLLPLHFHLLPTAKKVLGAEYSNGLQGPLPLAHPVFHPSNGRETILSG